MPIEPEVKSPSVVRGISLTEETSEMLDALAKHHKANASAVVRELIKQEYLHLASATPEDTIQ